MLKIVGDINFCDGYFDTGLGVGSMIRKGVNPSNILVELRANTGLATWNVFVPTNLLILALRQNSLLSHQLI